MYRWLPRGREGAQPSGPRPKAGCAGHAPSRSLAAKRSSDDALTVMVINKTSGKEFETVPLPAARQAIIDAGGLIPYTRTLVRSRSGVTPP